MSLMIHIYAIKYTQSNLFIPQLLLRRLAYTLSYPQGSIHTSTTSMMNNKQIIEGLYQNMFERNISKVLPVLDEHIKIWVPKSLPFGGEFLGREGFIAMVSKLNQIWEDLKVLYLHYYLPETTGTDHVLVHGKLEGKVFQAEESYTFHFISQWLLKENRIIEHSVFFEDTSELLQYINNHTNSSNHLLNGL